MKFLILRVLTHSELGMFHEYRRQGKEGSKQRAVNFDGDVVDRVFPAAQDTDRVEMNLRYDTDLGVAEQTHFLTRQGKNWRLEGNCPRDRVYAFVEPGCLFAMEVDAGTSPATGSWVVFSGASEIARTILDDGATSGLARAGMIALHGDVGRFSELSILDRNELGLACRSLDVGDHDSLAYRDRRAIARRVHHDRNARRDRDGAHTVSVVHR